MESWFSSWTRIMTGIVAVGAAGIAALTAQFDGDPLTVPDWSTFISLLALGLGVTLRSGRSNK